MPLDLSVPVPSADALAACFKALGDPARLRTLAVIAARGTICVGDLVTVLDLPQSTVSRHLAALKQARWVQAARKGTWVHYSLTERLPLGALSEELARALATSDAFAEDISRAASLAAAGGCCPQHPDTDEDG